MAKQSNKYTKSVLKLKEADIRNGKAVCFIGPDGIGTNLEDSWRELVIALIVVLNNVTNGKFLAALGKHKIGNNNMLITKERITTTNMGDNKAFQIPTTNHFIVINMEPLEYIAVIAGLCKAVKFEPKMCKIEIETIHIIEQETKVKSTENIGKFVRLSEYESHDLAKWKVIGIQIGFDVCNCKGYGGLVTTLIQHQEDSKPEWYSLLAKVNNKNGIEVTEDKSVVIQKGTDYKSTLQFAKEVCEALGIDAARVILTFRKLAVR